MGMLDNFILPAGASEAISKAKMRTVELDDGVSRLMTGHDGAMAYRFFIHAEHNKIKSEAAGYEVFDEYEMIEWLADRGHKPTEQVRFLPGELLSFNRDGEAVGGKYLESYRRFKEGKATPGTALAKWGILTDGEVASLSAAGIYTVEQFAAQPKDKIEGKYPQTFVDAYNRAKQYVNSRQMALEKEETVSKLQELQAANEELLKRLAKLEQSSKRRKKEDKEEEEETVI
jgi:hypothetical protein